MPLDESKEHVLVVDSLRTLSLIPTEDGQTIVLTVEDPHTVAFVELTRPELREFVSMGQKLLTATNGT
jgi:hypothetical protein